MVRDILKAVYILVSTMLIIASFSGCIQNGSANKIDAPTNNNTANENNTTAVSQIQNYTAELDGFVLVSISGMEDLIIGTVFTGNCGYFNITEPTKIQIIITYNSTYGDIAFKLTDPNPNNDDICWYSEGDGGGVETITLEKKDIEDSNDKSGDWFFSVYSGILSPSAPNPLENQGPSLNVNFHVKITVWDCSILNAHMYNPYN
jgi:hypothetical protein